MIVDTLGHLLALHVTPAGVEDGGEVERLARTVQTVTNDAVELAWVDQDCRSTRRTAFVGLIRPLGFGRIR